MSAGKLFSIVVGGGLFILAGFFAYNEITDHSGVYTAANPNQVVFLQIVQTPDSHFTGLLKETTVNADGTINQNNAPVSGSISGSNIMLSVRPLEPLPLDVTASGTVTGTEIALSMSGFGVFNTLTVSRSSMKAYSDAMSTLQRQANRLAQSHAQAVAEQQAREQQAAQMTQQEAQRQAQLEQQAAQRQAQLQQQIAQLNQFMQNVNMVKQSLDERSKSFGPWGDQFHLTTQRMQAYVDRNRFVRSPSDRSVMATTLKMTAEDSIRMHDVITQHRTQLTTTRSTIDAQVDIVTATCRTAAQAQPLCQTAMRAIPGLKTQLDAVAGQYRQLEDVYNQEMATQRQIVASAQQMASQ